MDEICRLREIKNMLHLIHQNNGSIRAGELEQLCIRNGILLNKITREPLSQSTRYRYRKALENLGLAQNKKGKYYISWNSSVFNFLMSTKFKENMNEDAKEMLKEIILQNIDCRKYFFDIFMINKKSYTLADFRKNGSHIFVEIKSMRELSRDGTNSDLRLDENSKDIILKNPNGRQHILRTRDQKYAIYTGIRLWSLKLEITNEIITNFCEGRIIYPAIQITMKTQFWGLLLSKIGDSKNGPEWTMIHIPTFLRDSVLSTHFQVQRIKESIQKLKILYPNNVMFIPTSTAFIDLRTPYNRQDLAFRNSYLYDRRKGYISHVRISRNIKGEANKWQNPS